MGVPDASGGLSAVSFCFLKKNKKDVASIPNAIVILVKSKILISKRT